MPELALALGRRFAAFLAHPTPGTSHGNVNLGDILRLLVAGVMLLASSTFLADVLTVVSAHAAELFTPSTAGKVVTGIGVTLELFRRLNHDDPASAAS